MIIYLMNGKKKRHYTCQSFFCFCSQCLEMDVMCQCCFMYQLNTMNFLKFIYKKQGAKKIIYTACNSGELKLAFTYQPRRHLNYPQKIFDKQNLFHRSSVIRIPKKKHQLPSGQVKNRIHWPDSKIHQPWAIRHHFLCTLKRCS